MARSPKLEPAQCGQCGTAFLARSYDVRKGWGRFCSRSCNAANRNGEASPHWKGGRCASRERYVASGNSAAQKRRWYAENREKEGQRFREVSRGRKAQMGQRLPRGTIPSIGEAQGWLCNVCRKDIRHAYHMDHIIPLARKGPHRPDNIQLLCPTCNLRKGARVPSTGD